MTNRRIFLKHSALAAAGLALSAPLAAAPALGAPAVLTPRRVRPSTAQGTLVFRPTYVQRGRGPHLLEWAYASDENWDAFYSDLSATTEGVAISDTGGHQRFGMNVRWNVEGFGYLFLTADNAGEHYALPGPGQRRELELGYELARSRVARNRRRLDAHRRGEFTGHRHGGHQQHGSGGHQMGIPRNGGHQMGGPEPGGYMPSREVQGLVDLSEGYLEDAERSTGERRAHYAQQALLYALRAGEALELEAARGAIERRGRREDFFFGCDARGFFQMNPDAFMELFTELFDYATITHYLVWGSSALPDFEPVMDDRRFDTREALRRRLEREGVTVQGRPLFYTYRTVTPDWLRGLSYDDLLRYIDRHTREVVGFYGDRMYGWEIVNELHDWANELQLNPDQTVELTKLACDVAADTAPNVHRLINNCCPYAEYVQLRKWDQLDAIYPQRTPWQFMRDLVDADVDFTITGQQMYFPYRDLQDSIMAVERMADFGRPVQITEAGATSGPSRRSLIDGSLDIPKEPYVWRRPWDEKLQADWMEGLYTLAYSKPWIEAVNWYDFIDGPGVSWIPQGGLLRGPQGGRKDIFHRIKEIQQRWGHA
jgi:endo-1,4-beta-xylanase